MKVFTKSPVLGQTAARAAGQAADTMPPSMPSPTPARPKDAWTGMGTGWAITSTLLAGMIVWGGIGFLIDTLVWSSRVFTALGIVLGSAAGGYVVYLRYARS